MLKKILSPKELNLPEKIVFAVKIAESLKNESSEINILPQINTLERIISRLEQKSVDVKYLQEELKIKSAELRESEIELDDIINRFSDFSINLSYNEY